MSHISKMKTKIKVNENVMDALKQCAIAIGATIKEGLVVESRWTKTTLSNGFVAKYSGMEIGVCSEDGVLTFRYDSFGNKHTAKTFREQLQQKYKERAISTALKRMGYTVQVKQKGKQTVIVGVG